MGLNLNFKHTTQGCTINQTILKGHQVLLLRLVNDCLIQCAQDTFLLILVLCFNSRIKVSLLSHTINLVVLISMVLTSKGSNIHIIILCQNCILGMLRAHAWDTPPIKKRTKNLFPLPDTCLKTIFQECCFDGGAINAYKLEVVQSFGYYTLLVDELMDAYVTCCPDIKYVISPLL